MKSQTTEKIIQKLSENPKYWEYKKQVLMKFLQPSNQTHSSNIEEVFKETIKNSDIEKNLITLLKESSISTKNITINQTFNDPITFVNEYKKKWIDFLTVQYIQICQNYYVLSSESKDDNIYFYDEQTFLNFICKMQNPQIAPFLNESTLLKIELKNYDSDIFLIMKNYCGNVKNNEEKEKFIEKMLERNVKTSKTIKFIL